MDCREAQKLIPDLRSGAISSGRKVKLMRHLAECETCRQWQKSWTQVCNFGVEVTLPRPDLDWSSFNQALEAEFRRNPLPGRQRTSLADAWRALLRDLVGWPNRIQIRALAAGAAAALVIVFSSQLDSPPEVQRGHLTIGEYLVSNQDDGYHVQYEGGETDRVYYHEEISLNLIEGRE
jgi:hypothetical protein